MSDDPEHTRQVEIATAMRLLPRKERDALILSEGVLDLRPRLKHRIKQRRLARMYRKPRGGGVA